MYTVEIDHLCLKQVAESGQAFRWKQISDNVYSLVVAGRYIEILQDGNSFTFSCCQDDFVKFWSNYFDMSTDYNSIEKRISDSADEHLKEAFSKGSGVRILRQELWEMIVTFMISQNNNISRITGSVEKLCDRCKVPLDKKEILDTIDIERPDRYSFPMPEQIDFSIFDDKTMGFGYRADYLREIYQYARNHPEWIDDLKSMKYEDAMKSLMERKGIGTKVANCICLFGLHHIDAFPIDTHVKQLLEKYYKDGFDFERYQGIAGVIQQYLFYFELKK